MKSKELNEILNKTRRTKGISLSVDQVEELVKDLEILEILKSHIILTDDFRYIRSEKRVGKEDCEKIMRWLENEK